MLGLRPKSYYQSNYPHWWVRWPCVHVAAPHWLLIQGSLFIHKCIALKWHIPQKTLHEHYTEDKEACLHASKQVIRDNSSNVKTLKSSPVKGSHSTAVRPSVFLPKTAKHRPYVFKDGYPGRGAQLGEVVQTDHKLKWCDGHFVIEIKGVNVRNLYPFNKLRRDYLHFWWNERLAALWGCNSACCGCVLSRTLKSACLHAHNGSLAGQHADISHLALTTKYR